ncbi:MAG: hypothetical protein JWP25_3838 [Bradyrhizobium sp.]|nr:hypothetical protein [Bradyrhizobium sp.]MEA2869080.1 hypothetical protein [Bradyrhizobium sp.]
MTPDAPSFTRARGVRLHRALLLVVGFMINSSLVVAQTPGPQGRPESLEKIIAFDIPSQPLSSALEAFSTVAEIELFYESGLVIGRRSSALRGQFSPDAALRVLLKGTDLSTASFEHGTITILPPERRINAAELAGIKVKAMEFSPYFAMIQASLRLAFCRIPAIEMDAAELRARLWIAPSGDISRAELLSSTGSDQRDQAYVMALRTLTIGASPPAAMPQPVTLMVLPRDSREAAECVQPGMPLRSAGHE